MQIRTLSDYCKERFGAKVYRLSLSTGCSCPNRDGKAGRGGCSFCSEGGSGEFASKVKDLGLQIEEAKEKVKHKFTKDIREEDKKYIAYFQSFTNTYGDVDRLEPIFRTAIQRKEIAALSIGTRPDCLEEKMLDLLEDLNNIKPVWIELGLQTINEVTAKAINRGYELKVFEKTYYELKKRGIEVIVHVILGLPKVQHHIEAGVNQQIARLGSDNAVVDLHGMIGRPIEYIGIEALPKVLMGSLWRALIHKEICLCPFFGKWGGE